MTEDDHETATDGGTDRAATDGGAHIDIFEIDEDAQTISSPGDRFSRMLDIYFYSPLRVAWTDWRARIGGAIILFYVLMGTVGVMFYPEPQLLEGPVYGAPFEDWSMPLGNDYAGRPIDRQIVHATPAMLKMGLAGVVFSAGVATIIGLVSGYKGGAIDKVLMTFTDIILVLPGLPLIIVIAAIYPPQDPFLVGVLIAIDSWPGLARALRSQVLTLREEAFVEASRAMGMPTSTIINKEVMPQLMPYITINASTAAAGVIGASVGLYFLGVLPFTTTNWGVLMNLAHQEGALANPSHMGHMLFFPALALATFTFGLVLFSQGMDRVFNPRLRARHAKTIVDDGEDDEMGGEAAGAKSVSTIQK